LNRRPEFKIETDSSEHLQGRGPVKNLVEDSDLELDLAEIAIFYSTRNDFAKKTQTGVYDSELVCLN
jgi:hypothetical protein